jgi:hypothetical protein
MVLVLALSLSDDRTQVVLLPAQPFERRRALAFDALYDGVGYWNAYRLRLLHQRRDATG